MKDKILVLVLIIGYLFVPHALSGSTTDSLKKGFLVPPDHTRIGLYWYWMNEHVSKEGITKDLEAMKRVGIGEAFIGNIYEGGEPGQVKTLSSEWMECMRHAIREATRLGLKVSIFNGPGWSQSGGPWIEPKEAMRFLDYSEKIVTGGKHYTIDLEQTGKDFQDVAVLAVPVNEALPKVAHVFISTECQNKEALWDNDKKTKALFANKQHEVVTIDFQSSSMFTARSLSIYPTGIGFNTDCELYAWVDGKYVLVSKEFFDRSNTSLQLGPTPDGKMVMAFKEVKATRFRVRMNNLPANFELAEIELSDTPKLKKVTEKSLLKLPNTSNPTWDAYRWNTQDLSDYKNFSETAKVLNLSSYVKDGHLDWKAPKGTKWKILRIGMRPTYTTNTPAAPVARGLEVDKLSRKSAEKHFNAFVKQIISGMSAEDSKSLNRVIIDSYEVGPQNWSDDFRDKFMQKTGYDPIPYLPVLTGEIIGSVDISDRFLWDLRRVVAELVAEEYVGGLRAITHKNGMKLWLENYGHWGYPSEFLYYGGQSDDIGGEFWAGSGPGEECRLAASACHIYGKNNVYAESYTAGGNGFKWYPALLKQKGDWSYTEGVNDVILHVYIHQPYDDKAPGINAWFGIEFNRHNTWFDESKAWIDYQRRCMYMLQQGTPVRNLCFYIGDDAPQMNYWVDKSLSNGYSYDLINADAILNRLTVKDGKLWLPNGIAYSALVLPPLKTMRPEVLARIEGLVKEGAVLVGKAPEYSPSLKNYPQCDQTLQSISQNLFPQNRAEMRLVGEGKVFTDVEINNVLSRIGVSEDLSGAAADHIKWIHRTSVGEEIYFLSNQGDKPYEGVLNFGVTGLVPEFWNAVDGTVRSIHSYKQEEGVTCIPVKLGVSESVFVVFSKGRTESVSGSLSLASNYPSNTKVMELSAPWNVSFENLMTGTKFNTTFTELADWKDSDDLRVKFFSGKAIYSTSFKFSKKSNTPIYIHFDDIKAMGTVYLNGKEVSTLWTAPYETDLSDVLVDGENHLEVKVANLWVNKLIEERLKSKEKRSTWTLVDVVQPDQPLESSGIIGKCYLFTR